jgi:hypothetical protein
MGALQEKTHGILHQNNPKNFSVLPAVQEKEMQHL